MEALKNRISKILRKKRKNLEIDATVLWKALRKRKEAIQKRSR